MHIKHLAVNEDRQKKIKSRKLTIYVVMISFSIANLFLPVLKTIKSVLPIPFCFRILWYVYRIATLVLPSESRAIDFLKLFGIVIYLRFKKKNLFSVHIILCLKLCYNSEKIKSFVNYRYSPFREWLFLFLRAITLHTVKRVL